MTRRRMSFIRASLVGGSLLAFGLWGAGPATADDETDDTLVAVRAALDAADCTASPPTITVLGLSVDVSQAVIEAGGGDDGDDGDGEGEDDDSSVPNEPTSAGCAALVPGASVDVELTSDAVPLVAIRVEQHGGHHGDDEPRLKGPLQAIDASSQAVTVLGLTVDASGAGLEGADDDCEDDSSQPVDFSQLIVGQYVEIELDPSQLPALVATALEVKNFANEVDVEVDDASGKPVDDGTAEDVVANLQETVSVTSGAKTIKKTVKLHDTSSGSFRISGLPTGKAHLTITRVHAGRTTSAKVKVKVTANSAKLVKVKLK